MQKYFSVHHRLELYNLIDFHVVVELFFQQCVVKRNRINGYNAASLSSLHIKNYIK